MGRITPEERDRRLKKAEGDSLLGTAGRYYERGVDIAGRAIELGLAGRQMIMDPMSMVRDRDRTRDEMGLLEPPSPAAIPGALGAGWEQLTQGEGFDWDAALAAYEEAAPAGPGFRGATELAAEIFAPAGLAKVGTRVISSAPALARTIAGIAPRVVRPAVETGIRTGLSGAGRVARAPWQAEEAAGRLMAKGIGKVAGPVVRPLVSRFRRPGAEAVEETITEAPVVEDILGPPPTTAAPVAPGSARPTGITPGTRGGLTGGLEVWVDPELRNLPFDEFVPGGSVYEQDPRLNTFNSLVRRETVAMKEWPSQSIDFVAAHEEAHGILGVYDNSSSQGVQNYKEAIRKILGRIKSIENPGGRPRERDYAEAGQSIYEDAFVNFVTGHSVVPSIVSGRRAVTDLTEAWADAYALHSTQPDLFRSLFPSEHKAFIKSLDELPSPNARAVDTRMRFIPLGAEYPTREVLPGGHLPRFGSEALTPTEAPILTPEDIADVDEIYEHALDYRAAGPPPTEAPTAPDAPAARAQSVVTGFREGASTKPLPRADQLKDNYVKPLSEYTDRLFHETNMNGTPSFLRGGSAGAEEIFWANSANLARGQTGKGVLLEFSSEGVEGQINRSKPMWAFAFNKGEAEFFTKYESPAGMSNRLISVTVEKGAFQAQRLIGPGRGLNPNTLNVRRTIQDWPKTTNPDGSVTYIRPTDVPVTPTPTTAAPILTPEDIADVDEIYERALDYRAAGPPPTTAAADAPAVRVAAEGADGPPSGVTEDAIAEAGDEGLRKGSLLQAKTVEALGPDYNVKHSLSVAQDLQDQIASIRNAMSSRIVTAMRSVGRVGRVESFGQSSDRMLDVQGTPSLYDVAENTKFYRDSGVLTPEQIDGVNQLTRIVADIKNERKIFGIGPDEIMLGEEGNFLPRLVVKEDPTPVGLRERLGRLIHHPALSIEEMAERGFGGGGFGRVGRGPTVERGRVVGVGEVAEAEARGVVYADPVASINKYINRWLTAAADNHVKSLLVPFGDSASMRLSPGLQNRMATLRQNVQSLLQSEIRILDEQDIALRAFLYSDDPGITQQFRAAIEGIHITKGKFKGQDLEGTRRILWEMKREIKELAPKWEKEMAAAKKTPEGRYLVSEDTVPMLRGMDWTRADKNKIQRHYSHWRAMSGTRNIWVSGLMQTTANVRFLNATFDFSALLRQQASSATVHPVTYLKNVFRGFVDVVNRRAYDEFLGSREAQHAGSRGIAIFGDTHAAELQATSWLDQVIHMKGWKGKPFLPLRAFNDHFIRFNTRQRIDLFHLEVNRLTKRYKRGLTPDEEEAVARAINRATGVSKTRGRGNMMSFLDDSLFAARYTRSTIEEIVEAARNGSIEGEIARRQILHLVGVVSGLSTAVAMMQNRPLEEVLMPFDMRKWDQGQISLNPNFLSIRVAGHDIKPLGSYDSLARILFTATDTLWGGFSEGQHTKLREFIDYSVGTKGNPLVSFGVDLFRMKTFTGENPFDPAALTQRVLPFGVQSAWESVQRGMPIGQAIGGAFLEGIGTKTSPMSFSDFTSEYARKKYGVGYLDLEPYQKADIREIIDSEIEAGRISRRQPADGYWAELESIDETFDRQIKTLVNLLESRSRERGEIISMYFDAREDRARAREYAAEQYEMEDYDINPGEDPNKLALKGYYDLYDEATVSAGEEGVPVYSSRKYKSLRSGYMRNLAIVAPEQLKYIYRNTNTRKIPTEILDILPSGIRNEIRNSEKERRDFESQRTTGRVPEMAGVR